MNLCVFCQSLKNNKSDFFVLPGVKQFVYIYDLFPVTPGHTLIVPRRHVSDFLDLTLAEKAELTNAIEVLYKHLAKLEIPKLYRTLLFEFSEKVPKSRGYLEEAIEKVKVFNRPPDGYNHGLNDCLEAGRTVNHLHYHIMPRWVGDSDDPRGGVRHMFLGKGNYHK